MRHAVRSPVDRILGSHARPAGPWAARHADESYGVPAAPDWRELDWNAHVNDVMVKGRRLRYVDVGAGDAPPAVFVHGVGGNWQNWLETLPSVARGRRVLALDLPGFGGSEMPTAEISISDYAETVDAWLAELGIGHVAVVGNSMGGFVAAELAISFPERVERLALVSAAGISITHLRRRPARTVARIGTAAGALTAARSGLVVRRERLRHVFLATVMRHPSRLRTDLLLEVLGGAGKPGYLDAMGALTSYDFRDRLSEIRCPTLIVWGRDDVLVPVEDAEEYERLIPRARRIVMDDTGHVPMLERARTFNRELEAFLAEETEVQSATGEAAG